MPVYRVCRLFAFACLLASASAWANPRVFPSDSFQVNLTSYADPYLTVDGEVLALNAAAIIYGTTNTTMVRGALQSGSWIRIQFDGNCMIKRVWVLNEDELTPVPFWTSLLGINLVPPNCPSAVAGAGGVPTNSTVNSSSSSIAPTSSGSAPSTSATTTSTTTTTTTATTPTRSASQR